MAEEKGRSRRDWLSKVLMGIGLGAAYGTFGVEFFSFVLPRKKGPKTRLLFAGRIDQYQIGKVRKFHDLRGGEILVRRGREDFRAFSSICPHLGCLVHWEPDNHRFFCPCHRGVFDEEGIAISGPPADAGQRLTLVPLEVNEEAGVVYIQVREPERHTRKV
jgi:cytochrome b6-f complex iron-sulfur subunit